MGHAIAFDTLAYAKKLIAAGVPAQQAEVQAEAIAEIIEDRLSTKQDLKELEVALKQDLKELEVALKYDILDLKRDMKEMEQRIIIKLGAMMAASIAIIAALIKLF